ncbi:hypothetical protein M9458_057625, partial [Cirrhinus mrigala]
EGSVEGRALPKMMDELPDPRSGREAAPGRLRARMPGRFTRLRKCHDERWIKPLKEAATPRARGPRRGASAAAGLRPLPGPYPSEHCPSFMEPLHVEDTRSPIYFGHFYSPPLDTFVYIA